MPWASSTMQRHAPLGADVDVGREGGDVPLHGEDAVDGQDPARLVLVAVQHPDEVVRVVVLELPDVRSDGQAGAVVDAGVVLPVEVDGVALRREGPEDAEVREEPRGEGDAGGLPHEGRQPLLELDVDVQGPVQEPASGTPGAVLPHGRDRAFLDLGVGRQPEVVVRPEHDEVATAHPDDGVLTRLDHPEVVPDPGGLDLVRDGVLPRTCRRSRPASGVGLRPRA